MSRFEDLDRQDKIKVILGVAVAIVLPTATYVFGQYFILEDRLHISSMQESGSSILSIMRTILPSMYLVLFLPTIIVVGVAATWLTKRSFTLLSVPFLLLSTAVYFLMVALLLTVFDALFAGMPASVHAFLMMIAFFTPAIMMARVLRNGRVHDFLKRTFR